MARSSMRKTNHRASQLFPRTKYSLTPTPSSCLSHRVCGPRIERHGLRRETGAGQNEHRGGQKKKNTSEKLKSKSNSVKPNRLSRPNAPFPEATNLCCLVRAILVDSGWVVEDGEKAPARREQPKKKTKQRN